MRMKKMFLFEIKISYFFTIFPSNLNGLGRMVQGKAGPSEAGGGGGGGRGASAPK